MTITKLRDKIFSDADKLLRLNDSNPKNRYDFVTLKNGLMSNSLTRDIYTYGIATGLRGTILRNSKVVKEILDDVPKSTNVLTLQRKKINKDVKREHRQNDILSAEPQVINRWNEPRNYLDEPPKRDMNQLRSRAKILNL